MIMGRKYKSYSYEEYMKAMELLEKGYGLTETCRLLGWPETKKSTLYYWKHGIIPPLAKWKAKPSRELAYVIGVINGDGNVCKDEFRHQYIIQLAVTDKEFTEMFSKVMARVLNVKYHKPYWDNKQKEWRVVYKSKAFYKWYKKCEEQGLQGFKEYIEYNKETVRYYLKGLYDSEGCNYRNKQIHLYNTKKKLLEYTQHLLEEYFRIVATGPYLERKAGTTMIINGMEKPVYHDYYMIVIGRKQHIRRFLKEIGFSIVRRQLGLRKDEKVFVEGMEYIEPYKLMELGLFELPFSDSQ